MNIIIKTLFEITIYSSIMTVAVLAMKAIWNGKISGRIIKLLWMLVLIRLLLPITFDSPVHIESILPEKPADTAVKAAATYVPEAEYTPVEAVQLYEEYEPGTDVINAEYNELSQAELPNPSFLERAGDYLKSISIWTYAAVLWAAGAAVLLIKTLGEYLSFRARVMKKENTRGGPLYGLIAECKAALGIKKDVSVLICGYLNTPVTFGLAKPVVLLPRSFATHMERHKLKMILLHELCHIKNRDVLKNMLWLMAKAVHWFNPLVWAAYRYYLEDVELACDETVISLLGDEDRFTYSQSLIDVVKLSKAKAKVPAAPAFCEDKTKIRKRVENMIEPKKKLKTAGFVSLIMAAVLIVGCFTTACQPKPDVTIQFDNTGNVAADDNNDSATPTPEPVSEPEPGLAQYQAPETFAKTYEKDSLIIMVDAQVEVPEVEKIYSVAFKNRELTQEMADNFLNYFIGDSPVYTRNNSETKASTLENELETWKQAKYNAENNWDAVKDRDPYQDNGGQQGAIDYIQGYIDMFESQLETAPEEYGYTLASRLIGPSLDDSGKDIPPDATEEEIAAAKAEDARVARENASVREMIAYAKMDESYIDDKMAYIYIHGRPGRPSTLSFDNANEANETGISLRREEMDELSETITLSLDDAVLSAKQVFQEMGFGAMYLNNYNFNALVKDGQTSPCYWLIFNQDIYGLPILPLTNGFKVLNRTEPKINEQKMLVFEEPTHALLESAPSGVASDTIYAVVDEDGVSRLSWDAALEQMDIVEEYTDILSFEQIISIFEDSILELYGNDRDLEMVINTISLSMLPVKAEGSDEIISVPVWDFRGYSYDPNDAEEKERAAKYNVDRTSFLTINAVDGSLINR